MTELIGLSLMAFPDHPWSRGRLRRVGKGLRELLYSGATLWSTTNMLVRAVFFVVWFCFVFFFFTLVPGYYF